MNLQRLLLCSSLALTFSQFNLPSVSAETASESIVEDAAHNFVGQLENGMTYSLLPTGNLNRGIWIKLNCTIPYEKDQAYLSQLVQQALFCGTQKRSSQDIVSMLDGLGLNVDPENFLKSNDLEHCVQFSLPANQAESVPALLALLQEIIFSPSFSNEGIEVARQHLLQKTEKTGDEALPIQTITTDEVREYYAAWYKPERMHLTIVGMVDSQHMISAISDVFGPALKQPQMVKCELKAPLPLILEKPSYAFTKSVEYNSAEQAYVVDGKIWMNHPNWINKSSNGKALGALMLTASLIGMGAALLLFPPAIPFALIAGSLSFGSGFYLLTSTYIKDPYYVEQVRKQDLQCGCAYAYENSRAGITLTPYERRTLFMEEMVYHPQTLSKLPILLLADLYQLHEPIIAEIFTNEEFNALNNLKLDFILQRNEYKKLKATLENELATQIAPYAIIRDSALYSAKDNYNQNYFVITEQNMLADLDYAIKDIERALMENRITLEQKAELVKKAEDTFEWRHSSPDFQAGLASAKSTLNMREIEIEAIYSHQVELCKQTIHYYERMDSYKDGENSLKHFYNGELYKLLTNFPISLALPDYLDLRG